MLSFCRNILGVHKRTSKVATWGELGCYPIALYIRRHSIKYYTHLNEKKSKKSLAYEAFECQKLLNIQNSWLLNISKIISLSENDHNRFQSTVYKIKGFNNNIKLNFKEQWRRKLNDDKKLNVLKQVKTNFILEPYLNNITDINLRVQITNFRISSHKLKIETGRHKQVNKDQRICKLCDSKY